MADIVLEGVRKEFPGGVRAVDDVSLQIEDGEFIVLVGPSGCGKSTLLRIIAGLEEATGGVVSIGGRDVTDLPPKDRDIAMVFQNYALYPHMTVEKNLGFGLKLAGVKKAEIRPRVSEAARILGLEQLLGRKPAALSGGQRQRVAMGRAIVREPQAFLMDEPLSNLDAKLRVQMRAELARLRDRLKTTTVYVTHDQVEAMTLGDRVAVMRDGLLQQVDAPQAVFERPANVFVAAFIGSPSMNLVEAHVGNGEVRFADYALPLPDDAVPAVDGRERVILGIRPTDFSDVAVAKPDLPTIEVMPEVVEGLGTSTHIIFPVNAPPVATEDIVAAFDDRKDAAAELASSSAASAGLAFTAVVDALADAQPGRPMTLAVNTRRFHFFDPASGLSLRRSVPLASASA